VRIHLNSRCGTKNTQVPESPLRLPRFRPWASPAREAGAASDARPVLSGSRRCSAPPLRVSCPDDGVLGLILLSAARWRDNPWRYRELGGRRNPDEDEHSGAGDGLGIGSEWGRTTSVFCVRTGCCSLLGASLHASWAAAHYLLPPFHYIRCFRFVKQMYLDIF
jgi:hypothetical protein